MSAVEQNSDVNHGVIRDFDYQDYLDESGLMESAESLSEDELTRIYGETIYEARKDELPDRHTRRAAFDEAREIVDNYDFGESIYEGLYDTPEELLVEAVSRGKMRDFELDVPWHPEVFYDEDKITTLPFQHSSAVLYSGRERHNFFDREYGKENVVDGIRPKTIGHMFNPDSVLEQGHFKAGNRHRDLGTGVQEDGTHEWAVYGADIHGAEGYASPIMVEFEVPSENLVMTSDNEPRLRSETAEEFFSKHDSPEEAKDYSTFILKVAANQEKQLWNPHVDLEDVNGVWDPEYFPNTMHFLSLDEYARRIQEDFDHVPETNLEQLRTEREGYTFRRPRGQQHDYSDAREEADVMAEIENEAAMAKRFFSKANSRMMEENNIYQPRDRGRTKRQLGANIIRNTIFANESMDVIEEEASRYINQPQIEEKDFIEFQESDTESVEQALEEIKQGSLQARKHVLDSVEEENIDREEGLEIMASTLDQNINDLFRIGLEKDSFLEFANRVDPSWLDFNPAEIEDMARNVYEGRVESSH
ncbi:hypothetical protein [Candidatus Nanohalovita haloferacivicina]|uniref:hypothetical protein n=1 Tax=Candidatus Nanohalovita haloferacivicina TaxID=2978046 RepID=UPI00325FC9A6|nr:hypothetical protein HBNXNv_0721 [Candidatus Nanohalobia archaeon BNXNv]